MTFWVKLDPDLYASDTVYILAHATALEFLFNLKNINFY